MTARATHSTTACIRQVIWLWSLKVLDQRADHARWLLASWQLRISKHVQRPIGEVYEGLSFNFTTIADLEIATLQFVFVEFVDRIAHCVRRRGCRKR
jgi:hypothetical protein